MAWSAAAILLAAAVLALSTPAMATHMSSYAFNPVEHDDQGRSNEPDGARSGLYDKVLVDCSLDVTGDGRCTPADLAAWPGGAVAPGCTGDLGRLPSGACGAWTVGASGFVNDGLVPPETVGVPGVSGPCPLLSGQGPLRVLDVHQRLMGPLAPLAPYPTVEVNRKLQDAGIWGAERRLLGDSSDVLVGSIGVYAWYGLFHDKNCNGVIDTYGDVEPDPRNEFTWLSDRCTPYTDPYGPRVVAEDVCRIEPTEFLGWEVPGNHHTNNGYFCGPACVFPLFLPADAPGNLALCTLQGSTPATCDAYEADAAGDSLLGPQGSSAPDWYFYDYTGTPGMNGRTYIAADPHPMVHYDPSIVVTTTIVGAVNALQTGEEVYDLGLAAMVDVDVLKTRNPAVEAYVQGLVKPTLRSTWLTLREAL